MRDLYHKAVSGGKHPAWYSLWPGAGLAERARSPEGCTALHVAVCRIRLHVYGSQSLKDKRRVVASLCERLRQRFPVAVAEVDGQDTWQVAVIGVAAVSGDASKAREIIDRVASHVREAVMEAEVAEIETDVFDY